MGWGDFVHRARKTVENVVKDPVSWINPVAAAQVAVATEGQSPTQAITSAGGSVQHGVDVATGKEAQRDAEKAMEEASMDTAAVLERMYQQSREDVAPWREAGERALGTLEERVAAGPGEYTKSPGYESRLKEGQRNLLAQTGGYRSGATDKALVRYGQDYATSDYDNFLNRYYRSLNPLQSLAGVGQSAGSQQAQQAQTYGQQAGQNIMQQGQQRASGYTDRYNTMAGLIGQGAGLAAMTYGGPGWSWGGK